MRPVSELMAPGRWVVDADQSSATFTAHGFWGAVPATGSFGHLSGTATLAADGLFQGELAIPSSTLSTGLWLRDWHLRSSAFFAVRRHTQIRFVAHLLEVTANGHAIRGKLTVREQTIELAVPVQLAEGRDQRVALTAEMVLDRATLGLAHSPFGMIRGPAQVRVHLVLTRDA